MSFIKDIQVEISKVISDIYQVEMPAEELTINPTKKEFEGDYTLVVFPLVRQLKKAPPVIADELGKAIVEKIDFIVSYNVIKGFLNFELSTTLWKERLNSIDKLDDYGQLTANNQTVLIEFSSPNTNKPLHLGHIRNILLGWSTSQILKKAGYNVVKTQIVNDRGIAICKSMLAWEKYGEGKTPESTQTKGDHFVGDYYVLFETKFKEEYAAWQTTNVANMVFEKENKDGESKVNFFKSYKNKYFNEYSSLGKEAKSMLLKWEANDTQVRNMWETMNNWTYSGFGDTYKKLGVHFDSEYHESNTYLLGKEMVELGLSKGIFYQKDDNSVWIDLEPQGMDHKIVQRSDGTSVYVTQDLGTAHQRYADTNADKMVYVVADEQDYHFKVLFEILKQLEEPYADGLAHLSYGMVDLPTGKMKSREGTVVDADDLIDEVIAEARKSSEERGNVHVMSDEEYDDMLRKVGLAALKYFIIKVNPKKRMIFNPEESVDMQGTTGPYIQNAYVRIKSILRKAGDFESEYDTYPELNSFEKELMVLLLDYPDIIAQAALGYDPSMIANYLYVLAKNYHRFYHEVSILKAESEESKRFRLTLSSNVAKVLKSGLELLGIEVMDKM